MPTKYEYYDAGDDGNYAFYQTVNWQAQTFTPSIRHTISYVVVKLLRFAGSVPGNITASIRRTDSEGKPTGSDLCSGTVDGSAITTVSPGEWVTITFSTNPILIATQKYALILKCQTDDPTKPIYWRRDGSSPSYAGGSVANSSDLGVTWMLVTNNDFMFEEWGTLSGIYPTDPITRVTGLVHRWSPGHYSLEIFMGDTRTDWGEMRPQSQPAPSVSIPGSTLDPTKPLTLIPSSTTSQLDVTVPLTRIE